MIDLHIHSTCSDGTFTPKQIVQKVIAKGLYGFSLTDHDTVDGIPEILAMDLPDDLKFISGIEISCDALHREIHVLGYGINYKDQQLNQTLNMLRDKRFQRNLDMIELFQKDGYPITLEKLQNGDPHTVITRAHFARTLIAEGICSSMDQAFSKYLGEKCKYYVPKPFLYKFSNEDTKHLIHDLKEEGLAGIEVYHSSHHIGQITKLRQWQKEYDLLATGGSDFHGTNKPDIEIGTGRGPLFVPDHLIDDLMN